MTLSAQTIQQLLLLPKGAVFVVAGIHNVAGAEDMLRSMGRKDAAARSEYWVEGLSWAREPARQVVLDTAFRAESVWMSERMLLALEILRLLGRTA